jgi:hypothetical protein
LIRILGFYMIHIILLDAQIYLGDIFRLNRLDIFNMLWYIKNNNFFWLLMFNNLLLLLRYLIDLFLLLLYCLLFICIWYNFYLLIGIISLPRLILLRDYIYFVGFTKVVICSSTSWILIVYSLLRLTFGW